MGFSYGVATSTRLLKHIGLFCRILLSFIGLFCKRDLGFREPTNCSHPIGSECGGRDECRLLKLISQAK